MTDTFLNRDPASFPDEVWQPLGAGREDAERIARPSLSYAQDSWRRLRRNKVAMLSLVVILIIILTAVFVPFFWPYRYEQQNLYFGNLPPFFKIHLLDSDTGFYVSPSYTVIETQRDGTLIRQLTPLRKDLVGKKTYYDVDGRRLVIDYSFYTKGLAEFKKLEAKAGREGSDTIPVAGAEYLKSYFADAPDVDDVSIEEARDILEHRLPKMQVTIDDRLSEASVTVRNRSHLFGTDNLGRDLFIRIVYGARVSLLVGLFAALINLVVGVLYGGISGYFGGRIDLIMMRIVDTIYAIPMTLYVILIMVIIGPGLRSIILSLGLTYWVGMARLVRGQVLSLKQQEFVKAAGVIGADTKRILFRHLIPNMMGPIMVSLSMQIPSAIFTEAFLSFIGLGISAPQASWGTLANDALSSIYIYPYQMFLPAAAIAVTVLALNLFSDGLRDALDPRQRK